VLPVAPVFVAVPAGPVLPVAPVGPVAPVDPVPDDAPENGLGYVSRAYLPRPMMCDMDDLYDSTRHGSSRIDSDVNARDASA